MDVVAQKVNRVRSPLKIKFFKKFLISETDTTSFHLEFNKFNDYGIYFGISKSWKKAQSNEWKHANSVNLPISLWPNLLNIIPQSTLAIGTHSEH